MSFRLGILVPRFSAHTERDLFSWSLLVAIVLLSLLASPFFAGDLYTSDNLSKFHLPARAFYAEQIAQGESFDWMPSIYSGFYLTGEGQVGSYHPWHRLLYRFLPLHAALGWEYLCSYPIMLAGMYLFLRRRLHRRDAAMVGSLAFTFSSFNMLHFVHPNAVAAVAHIPWLLTMIDIALVDAKRWKVALAQAALALLTGSQLLLGCPEIAWFSLLAEIGLTVFLVTTRRFLPRDGCETMATCRVCIGCRRNSASYVVVGKCVGLLVGAIQLLPMLDALGDSTRHAAAADTGAVLHPINLVQLVAPYLPIGRVFGNDPHELSLYVGAVPLMLAAWVFIRRKELGGLRRSAQAAGLLALGAIVLTFATQGKIVRLQNYIPWAAWFQHSSRYIVLFQFALALLAAIGFVLLEREAREKYKIERHLPLLVGESRARALWRKFEVLGALVLVSVGVAVAGLILQAGHFVASPARVLVGPLLMVAAAALTIAASQGIRGALVGLILFMAADLGYYGLSCTLEEPGTKLDALVAATIAPPSDNPSPGHDQRSKTSKEPGGVRVFAPSEDGYRDSTAIGNQMTLTGCCRVDGYADIEPRKVLDYHTLASLRVASTNWVYRGPVTDAIDGLKPYDENWLRVPDPLPRARLVTKIRASTTPAEDLSKINAADEALCEYSLALPPGKPGTARITQYGAGRISIKVCCATPQMLTLAESYHPGWQCTVDGTPRQVYRVNGDFLGCVVEPGNAEVRLEFHPESLWRGWLASLAGLGLVGFCLVSNSARRELAFVEKIGKPLNKV